MLYFSIAVAKCEFVVGIYAPVAQERPPAPYVFASCEVDVDNGCSFLIVGRLIEKFTLRSGNEARSPELYTGGKTGRVGLETYAVYGYYGQAVGNSMSALYGLPSLMLASLLVGGVAAFPADCSRVDEYLRSGKSHHARSLRIPLVPAHKHTELAERCVDRIEAEIARCEIEFLIICRVVGDMHFTVFTCH